MIFDHVASVFHIQYNGLPGRLKAEYTGIAFLYGMLQDKSWLFDIRGL
jgi:hypothetical protein